MTSKISASVTVLQQLPARTAALRRDGFRCVCCGEPASEMHHLDYPPWGTFDVPSNMESVCHACHCRIEGKPA